MRIFLIDDSRSMIAAMQQAIASLDNVEVIAFLEPVKALGSLAEEKPDLILVDYSMPGMSGIDVIRQVRATPETASVPVIMVTSNTETGLKMAAMEAGATEFLSKPFDQSELKIRVSNLLSIRAEQRKLALQAQELQRKFEEAMARVERREEEIIWRLSRAIGCRDGETGQHLDRVAVIARMIAEELGFDERQAREIFLASPLHDVGKLAVKDAILLKPGRLTPDEFTEMKKHTEYGQEILKNSSSDLIKTAERIAASHHEKWDGTGYPRGLKGTEIPIEARIVAVADVFDALCSERPYKQAWPLQKALQEIMNNSGKHFDPSCVAAFARRWAQIRELFQQGEEGSYDETKTARIA
ncbi:transcriptional regulator [Rhizobium sp. Root149]|uniref:HD-GYP domain-containing protein n=1 Tax=Rhizobium sp. Root149 TaxID=1736473 RepID=UPI000712F438|nr:HD domain-containing phosphohydrolase [Rhizobium sp. Root149]KQZ47770.1 transcriptional regulator [Rhizobium sp. Root149]